MVCHQFLSIRYVLDWTYRLEALHCLLSSSWTYHPKHMIMLHRDLSGICTFEWWAMSCLALVCLVSGILDCQKRQFISRITVLIISIILQLLLPLILIIFEQDHQIKNWCAVPNKFPGNDHSQRFNGGLVLLRFGWRLAGESSIQMNGLPVSPEASRKKNVLVGVLWLFFGTYNHPLNFRAN